MVLNRANLTPRDRAVLDTLTLRVRVLSVDQIARTWFGTTGDPIRQAQARLSALERGGLVERWVMLARPELRLDRPIVVWEPGQPRPEFSAIASILAARWREPVTPVPVITATKTAGTWMGGYGGRRPRRSESSHDLALGSLYLRWLSHRSSPKETWISEARLRREGFGERDQLPDAMIDDGASRRVIEMGGAYSAAKLWTFHGFCSRRGLPYELW